MTNDPFQLFAIQPQFDIDLSVLKAKYWALQKQFHPDNYAGRTSKEKLMATQISANVVAAYKTLLDPVLRASALLNLAGMAFDLETYKTNDKLLLMQQLELREQLESTEGEALNTLKETFTAEFSRLTHEFSQALTTQQLENAAEVVLKMRYYQKLLTELNVKIAH